MGFSGKNPGNVVDTTSIDPNSHPFQMIGKSIVSVSSACMRLYNLIQSQK